MNVGSRAWQAGFTLIELLVTLVVAIVLATIAIPGFQHLVASNREASTEVAIRSGFNLARSEAIKRRAPVSLTVNADGALQAQVQSDTLRQVNLAKQVVLVLPNGTIIFTSLGRLAEGSGNNLCATFDDGDSLQFELSQAGGLTVQRTSACNG